MSNNTDFRTLSERQLAEQLVISAADLGDQHTTDTLNVDEILEQVSQGLAIIVAERDAIALVRPEGRRIKKGEAVLWLLYVKPDLRGKGVGKAFVANLRHRFVQTMPMILACNGSRREDFFAACGFRLKERTSDGGAIMVTGDKSHGA